MTAAGVWAPWLALVVVGAAASASIWTLMRNGCSERALLAVPTAVFGAVAGLLVVLVPYLVIVPPASEPVVLAATASPGWQQTAAVVVVGWTCATSAAVITAYRYHAQRRRWEQQHD